MADLQNLKANLFLVGAMKAGTTTIASALAAHPDIFSPSIKEPHHFCPELHCDEFRSAVKAQYADIGAYLEMPDRPVLHAAYVEDAEHYARLFEGGAAFAYRLDASTGYLNSPHAAEVISRYNPDARIIIVRREPISRAWSEFQMNQSIGRSGSNWRDALRREAAILRAGNQPLLERYISTGWYDIHAARFYEHFSKDQIFEGTFSDLKGDAEAFYEGLGGFLGLDKLKPGETLNSAKKPKFAALNRFLHQSGLKSFAGERLGSGAKEWLKRTFLYSDGKNAMPPAFAEEYTKLDTELRPKTASVHA